MTIRDRTLTSVRALAAAWNTLRLAVEASDRVAFWDMVVLTAASEAQARLYEKQAEQVRRRGLLPPRTRVLVAADPGGKRIGSGGATLNALRRIRADMGEAIERARILLIHAGGDSKRLPWAGVFGKVFVPVPLLCDPDRHVPTLFEQLLAVTAPAAATMAPGSLWSLSGDVLPLFAAGALPAEPDAAMVVTRAEALSLAGRHGVIIPGKDGVVQQLLQKPRPEEIAACGGLVHGGAALIDTGIYGFTGRAFQALLDVSAAVPDPVERLLEAGLECSLYQEIAWAMVDANRPALRDFPLGGLLLERLAGISLRHHEASDLMFLHLGTSAEILEHLGREWYGRLSRRVLATLGPGVAESAYVYSVDARETGRLGERSLVTDSTLGPDVQIGNRCILINVDGREADLTLPSHLCLWQLPVHGPGLPALARVTAFCGVDDNPKLDWRSAAFGNHAFSKWMAERGIVPEDLWEQGAARTLWNARIFPVHDAIFPSALLSWLLPSAGPAAPAESAVWLERWRRLPRLSMAEMHVATDIDRLIQEIRHRRRRLVAQALRRSVRHRHERNIAALVRQLDADDEPNLLNPETQAPGEADPLVPASRRAMIRADLWAAVGDGKRAAEARNRAFEAIHDEVAAAGVRARPEPVRDLPPGRRAEVALPVRFDFAGGWSDTPPWCLERPAAVLNMALALNGRRPVQVTIEALPERKWDLTLADTGQHVIIENTPEAGETGNLEDAFTLLRTALVLTGFGGPEGISQGVRIVSRAAVPRGSGLGTSSILGAAVVRALRRLAGRPADDQTIIDLVLQLEQMMTTGGGWQDQVGGLIPGVKLATCVPVHPLSIHIERVPLMPGTVEEFTRRFVVAYSGIDRLAKNVLQIVVGRYLQRDHGLIHAIESLVELAAAARDALALGALDTLGGILREVWMLHQQLDPHCSNPEVDALFAEIDDLAAGYKLAGAGGGGFMGILAKDAEAAGRIRKRLAAMGNGVQVYDWTLGEEPPGTGG